MALKHDILAYGLEAGELYVAVPDANDEMLLDRLRFETGLRIRATSIPREVIRETLPRAYPSARSQRAAAEERDDAAPAIRVVDEIHDSAIKAGASDLHLEPSAEGGRVRLRVDGVLCELRSLPAELFVQIISRIKLLAAMDIADKRQPQDGRYQIDARGRSIDARVSSMPTIDGEKIVIRLLDMRANIPSLERLGMPAQLLGQYRRLVHAPHGFIVVCGPTGSGKTTTLYASLAERNVCGQHLCTVEDPVEVRIPGVAQVQVNTRAGLTFASTLRSFLRQDPNVIMVGEMRDTETASVGISAALSGQLVLTTLHASDAPSTVERLTELGMKRHAIAAGLTGIVAQRLVRRLCQACRRRSSFSVFDASIAGIPVGSTVFAPRGCEECAGTGYSGRTAIFELIQITDSIRNAIAEGISAVAIVALAKQSGYRPMIADGIARVLSGDTSIDELHRVLALDAKSQ